MSLPGEVRDPTWGKCVTCSGLTNFRERKQSEQPELINIAWEEKCWEILILRALCHYISITEHLNWSLIFMQGSLRHHLCYCMIYYQILVAWNEASCLCATVALSMAVCRSLYQRIIWRNTWNDSTRRQTNIRFVKMDCCHSLLLSLGLL